MKSSEVSIKTRSTPASLTIQGQVTKDTTVKWSIAGLSSNDAFPHISKEHMAVLLELPPPLLSTLTLTSSVFKNMVAKR